MFLYDLSPEKWCVRDVLLDKMFVDILTHIKLPQEHFAEEVHLFLVLQNLWWITLFLYAL